jgi:hypothetical protein
MRTSLAIAAASSISFSLAPALLAISLCLMTQCLHLTATEHAGAIRASSFDDIALAFIISEARLLKEDSAPRQVPPWTYLLLVFVLLVFVLPYLFLLPFTKGMKEDKVYIAIF